MEGTRPDLHVVRLLNDAAFVGPEFLQCEYEVLKVHAGKIHVFYTTKESDLPMIFKSQAKDCRKSQVTGHKSEGKKNIRWPLNDHVDSPSPFAISLWQPATRNPQRD
jgi:hypothetical protein